MYGDLENVEGNMKLQIRDERADDDGKPSKKKLDCNDLATLMSSIIQSEKPINHSIAVWECCRGQIKMVSCMTTICRLKKRDLTQKT